MLQLEKIAKATEEEIVATMDQEEIDALRGGLDEITRMRSEIWIEIQEQSKSDGLGHSD
ncbi:hypothetical protein [Magnetospirillum sp. XM-1]|uniref:hypothetical protein n=1 Tax=Magnetospirillum sp. XM-1 TaxID=1663591 RepID=UPI0012E3CA4C|nr:hypothetical protein [Magnetospirillum sp. XM-1]